MTKRMFQMTLMTVGLLALGRTTAAAEANPSLDRLETQLAAFEGDLAAYRRGAITWDSFKQSLHKAGQALDEVFPTPVHPGNPDAERSYRCRFSDVDREAALLDFRYRGRLIYVQPDSPFSTGQCMRMEAYYTETFAAVSVGEQVTIMKPSFLATDIHYTLYLVRIGEDGLDFLRSEDGPDQFEAAFEMLKARNLALLSARR